MENEMTILEVSSLAKRRYYDKVSGQEAVCLVGEDGLPIAQVEWDLDANQKTIYQWLKESDDHGESAFPTSGNVPDDEKEIPRLGMRTTVA
jgi:transposase-like protein